MLKGSRLCERHGCDEIVPPVTVAGGKAARFCSTRCYDRERRGRLTGTCTPSPTQMVAWLNATGATVLHFPLGWKVMLAHRVVGEGDTVEAALRAAMAPTREAA